MALTSCGKSDKDALNFQLVQFKYKTVKCCTEINEESKSKLFLLGCSQELIGA